MMIDQLITIQMFLPDGCIRDATEEVWRRGKAPFVFSKLYNYQRGLESNITTTYQHNFIGVLMRHEYL